MMFAATVAVALLGFGYAAALEYGVPFLEIDWDNLDTACSGMDTKSFLKNPMLLLKMIDASGKLPPGILTGNVMEYGNYDECLAIADNVNNVSITGKYCTLAADISMQLGGYTPRLLLSMCIPSVCKLSEMLKPINGTVSVNFNDKMCQVKGTYTQWDDEDKAMAIVLACILAVIVMSTVYDIVLQQFDNKAAHPILITFSVLTNGQKLLTTTNNPDQLHCLNGMRFIGMMWIIAGHRFVSTQAFPILNRIDSIEWMDNWATSYIQGARVAVDTFFFMSAFLVSYSYFKSINKKNALTIKAVPILYVHRIIRITPALAAMYFIHITLLRRMATGPVWMYAMEMTRETCVKWWWSFFLYIQNYTNYEDMCIVPTWYLSADMQMFIIAPFIVLLLGHFVKKDKRKWAYIINMLMILICVLVPMTVDFFREFKNEYDTHTRLSIYMMGILMGMFVVDIKNRKNKVNPVINILIWTVMFAQMLTIIIYTPDVRNHLERDRINLFHTFSRPAWALGIAWIIYACITGNGGIVNWILSRPMFQILGRLSYSMYLLHNPIITIYIAYGRTSIHFSDYTTIYTWCGDLIITTVLSVAWVLAFESPMIGIEKLIFGRGEPKKIEQKKNEDAVQ